MYALYEIAVELTQTSVHMIQDLKSKLSNLGKARARLPKVDEAMKKAEVQPIFRSVLAIIDCFSPGNNRGLQ